MIHICPANGHLHRTCAHAHTHMGTRTDTHLDKLYSPTSTSELIHVYRMHIYTANEHTYTTRAHTHTHTLTHTHTHSHTPRQIVFADVEIRANTYIYMIHIYTANGHTHTTRAHRQTDRQIDRQTDRQIDG